jgi:hypothetical protein
MSYDPTTGRWISQDPIAFKGGDANLYRYVGNNLANFTDTTGLQDTPVATPPVNVTILDPGSSKRDTNGNKRKKGFIGSLATWGYYCGSLFDGNDDVVADDLKDAVDDLEKMLQPGQKIGEITIKGHGNQGLIGLGGSYITIDSFAPGSSQYNDLVRLRDMLDKRKGKIVILECMVLGGDKGKAFGQKAADFFGVTIGGHQEIIAWPYMPGYIEYDPSGKSKTGP